MAFNNAPTHANAKGQLDTNEMGTVTHLVSFAQGHDEGRRSDGRRPRGRGGRLRAAALVGGRYAVLFLGSASLRADAVDRLRASSVSDCAAAWDRIFVFFLKTSLSGGCMEFPELANPCSFRGCSEKNDFLPFTCVALPGGWRRPRPAPVCPREPACVAPAVMGCNVGHPGAVGATDAGKSFASTTTVMRTMAVTPSLATTSVCAFVLACVLAFVRACGVRERKCAGNCRPVVTGRLCSWEARRGHV
jgi:hypothetical protein